MEMLRSELSDAVAGGTELDLCGATVPAVLLVELLTAPPAGRAAPALRVRGAVVSGPLRLVGARVEIPVELLGCRFDQRPDLRMAHLAGLALTGSRLPGLRAGNLTVEADLLLDDGFRSHDTVELTDAQVRGSLRLSGAHLAGVDGRALVADRLVVEGACYARRLVGRGELRLPGASITGNLDLAGATIHSPTGDALDATGLTVGGSVIAARHHGEEHTFRASGRVLVAGARVGGDLVLAGARISVAGPPEPRRSVAGETGMPVVPAGIVDPSACLVADRIQVDGNTEIDDGARIDGTVRLPNARIGGYLRLSGAVLTGPGRRGVALLGDGLDVGGDLDGRDQGRGPLVAEGPLRLVDAHVRGSASLSGVRLQAPEADALHADRLRIGGELYLRGMRCDGTVRLQHAEIGSTLDCTGARLDLPRLRADGTARPSLDARAATIGKDLVCAGGFRATGGIRIRLLTAGKSVRITDVDLGGSPAPAAARYAINAYGLRTAELVVAPLRPPDAAVRLSQAKVETFADSEALWHARGGLVLDGFDYEELNDTRVVDVHKRLSWLERVQPDYAPGPYEQLAAAYRRAGDEELGEQVLIARQRRRYAEQGAAGRAWGQLQWWTVGFGYRPWLAVLWLALCWALGGAWFAAHPLAAVDSGQNPVWNPWLFAADTLLPIVNLGQDGYWRLEGSSQWIASGLVAAGWILATTAAAGAARVLKRV